MKTKMTLLFLFVSYFSFSQYIKDPKKVYNVDNFPTVYGGNLEWKRFLHDHLVYPKEDLENKIQGTVKIIFIVKANGKGIDPKLARSVSPAIDKEALRLFNMIEWFPSTIDGEAVNVIHDVEFNFSLTKYKKWTKERGYDLRLFNDLPSDTSLAIYDATDKTPSFFNTEKTFTEFISSNLEYPEVARKKGLEGNISMSFIVEPDGRTSNIRIQKGVEGGCNEEAIRVIGLTTWKPAIENNKYVRFRMHYVIAFSLKTFLIENSPGSQQVGGQ